MDKKQLISVVLMSIMVVLLLQMWKRSRQEAPPAGPPAAESPYREQTGWSYGGTRVSREQIDNDEVPAYRLGALEPDPDKNPYRFQLTLDPRGAAVRFARLAGYYDTVEHKRAKDKTPEQLQAWSYAVLNPVETNGEVVLPFSTPALLVAGAGEADPRRINTRLGPLAELAGSTDPDAPPGGLFHIGWEKVDQRIADDGTQVMRFRLYLFDAGADRPSYTLIKTYELPPDSYSFRMTLQVYNHTGTTRDLGIVQNGPTGIPLEGVRGDQREVIVADYITAKQEVGVPKNGKVLRAKSLTATERQTLGTNAATAPDPALWAGAGNKFFASLMYPIPDGIRVPDPGAGVMAEDLVVPPAQYPYTVYAQMIGAGEDASQRVTLETTPVPVAHQAPPTADELDTYLPSPPATQAATQPGPAAALTIRCDVFVGPKDGEKLEATPLHAMLRYRNAISFQSCQWCLIEPLVRAVMWLIAAGGGLLHNYGVMIILLVLVIRLALHPITKRSQVGMMKMRKLQPQMQEIQEKYKDDKEGQQKAMMAFMRQTGFSPVLGCLPMLLQMPIWIALWAGLNASVVLRHEGLLPFWITNLAGPDTVLKLAEPYTIPLLGKMMGPVTGLNILPLLLAVFMFLQQKLMPMQAPAAGASKEQQNQQKMMMYFMSGFMLLIFYNAPSGLTLYIMASTGYGVLESYVIRKHIREKEEQEAAAEVRVVAPGKRPRGTRPKKPKDRLRP